MSQCCLQGFQWDGTPNGKESTLANNKAYINGSNPDVAILVIPDLFGWTFINERLFSDHYAKEADTTVFMPDLMTQMQPKEVRWPELLSCVQALRAQYKRVGVLGYCYGGWSSFRLGSKSHSPSLVDCISAAHPTWLTKEEMDDIGVPAQILAPEVDPAFTPELKKYANEVIPTKGVPYDYQFFPEVEHGLATRGNPSDEKERKAMVRGKNVQVAWMREWLHG